MSRDAQMADASSAADPTPMEPLLRLVNKLQEACALAGDVADSDASGKASKLPSLWETLPQIVVVGGQSSGKSSVLEAIVGRDFLPRGAGICTRRPLVLQLHGAPASEVASARFLHKPKTVFSDFNEVRLEIERETDRSLQSKGHKKAVSAEPIMLSIRAAGAPSLTLVDMPGLTKVATADQPASTVADIETMAKKFIVSKNVVIVAVSAANADIATSDGVRVAKEVDPNSTRTLGVLTKLDLMDKGTDATEVLSGKAVHLGLGWCAVVNRSQSDIASGVDMSTARANERAWFEAHREVYATETDDFDSSNDNLHATTEYTRLHQKKNNLGTDALVSALVNILGEQVRRKIPKIRDTVEMSSNALEMELARLGPATPHFPDRGALVHEVLRGCDAYERDFADELDKGTGERDSRRRRSDPESFRERSFEKSTRGEPRGVLRPETRAESGRRVGRVPAAPGRAGDGHSPFDRARARDAARAGRAMRRAGGRRAAEHDAQGAEETRGRRRKNIFPRRRARKLAWGETSGSGARKLSNVDVRFFAPAPVPAASRGRRRRRRGRAAPPAARRTRDDLRDGGHGGGVLRRRVFPKSARGARARRRREIRLDSNKNVPFVVSERGPV
jgi:GTP-binding protein EngB required for normal cell division